ncbi:hypothetical protein F4680DRAFT_454317 [Xylaria scruposa]|nr:hypothetical protein F4680DRAFT_454317 [Xylaria scruposa]
MDLRRELHDALHSFYGLIISVPCLDDFTIATPPDEGWSISNPTGKDDNVIDLLRYVPYLRRVHPSSTSQLPIYPGMIPICYPDDDEGWIRDKTWYSLPSHCVYLAHRDDSKGTDLILDASNGTVTEFGLYNSMVPHEEYETLPEAERWRAHPTTPLTELLDKWTRMYRQLSLLVTPNPVKCPTAVRFYIRSEDEANDATVDYEGGSESDREQRDEARHRRDYTEKVYDVYIRYGWPADFKTEDRERLRAELLALEQERWAEDKRIMNQNNPDAALFD